jgi:GNAT superfamily N-acetyltransferase
MAVRRIVPGDEKIFRSVRLQALADSPDDFDSTLDLECRRTEAEWRDRISVGASFVFEDDSDGPRGLAGGVPHRDEPGVVFLVAVWVHPTLRGTGAADALVAAVLSWADAQGAAEVRLHVDERNGRARRFYERCGFRATGEKILRERDGFPEIEMRSAR